MNFRKSIIPLTLLVLCSLYCGAQDSNYVYRDTAILNAGSALENTTELAPDENTESENPHEIVPDTILKNNQLPVEPDSIKALKNSKPFAYAKNLDSLLFRYRQSLEKEHPPAKTDLSWIVRFFLSPVTKYFFWMLAVLFVGFILYKLFFTEGFFQRPFTKMNVKELPDEVDKLSKTTDYGTLAALAVSSSNFRLAVRYLYLQSLQKLSSKNAIRFAADKTNYQYVNELTGKSYKNEFASLTLHYEYVWYGEFEIDENMFYKIQNKFKQFNSGV